MRNQASSKTRNVPPSPFEIVALLERPDMSPARKLELAGKKMQLPGAKVSSKKSRRQTAKRIEFKLESPTARSVRLAADFTNWEDAALNMTRTAEGIWRTAVALPTGRYAYKFIVDGQWWDDPHTPRRAPNPFGTYNTLIEVV